MARGADGRPGAGSSGLAELATPRRIALLLLLVAFAVWCAANSDEVSVSFLFTSTDLPLFVALLLAGVVGAGVGFLVSRRGRDD